jgi:hypothetical protein
MECLFAEDSLAAARRANIAAGVKRFGTSPSHPKYF